MELTVINTGSQGNCYLLQNANSALVIEAGVSFLEVKKHLHFNVTKLRGVLLSHSHGDHSKYVVDYLKYGVPVYMHPKTVQELSIDKTKYPSVVEVIALDRMEIKEFSVLFFELVHDVVCLGFKIRNEETGELVFITDSKYSPFYFENVNNWIIECNHSRKILHQRYHADELNGFLLERVMENHFSLEELLILFDTSNMAMTRKIVLIHGSDTNSHSVDFRREVINHTGKDVYVAEKGLKLNINKTF